jgi:hypothetical protein
MSDRTVTGIARFGESSAALGAISAEIDGAMHLDDDGNERTAFLPGEAVFFILHHDANVKIVRLRATDGGDVQLIGPVVRSRMEQITFEHPAHLVDLPHKPNGQPTAKWYGRSSNLYLSGQTLQADLAPCLGDISYKISATQFLHRPISGITLQPGEEFPVDIVIEYRVEG